MRLDKWGKDEKILFLTTGGLSFNPVPVKKVCAIPDKRGNFTLSRWASWWYWNNLVEDLPWLDSSNMQPDNGSWLQAHCRGEKRYDGIVLSHGKIRWRIQPGRFLMLQSGHPDHDRVSRRCFIRWVTVKIFVWHLPLYVRYLLRVYVCFNRKYTSAGNTCC